MTNTLYGKKDMAGGSLCRVPECLEMKRLSWIIQVTLSMSTCILTRRKKRGTGTLTDEEETV